MTSDQFLPGVVVCYFVRGVKRADVAEFIEPAVGATVLHIIEEPDKTISVAHIGVPVGTEIDFLMYAEDDVMVKSASRPISLTDPNHDQLELY